MKDKSILWFEEISKKDVKDILVLLLEHEIGSDDKEKIDVNLIADMVANDWGFYYTITTNLGKLKQIAQSDMFEDFLGPKEREVIIEKVDAFQKILDDKPKGRKWRLRAKIGPKKKWYKEVHTVSY